MMNFTKNNLFIHVSKTLLYTKTNNIFHSFLSAGEVYE